MVARNVAYYVYTYICVHLATGIIEKFKKSTSFAPLMKVKQGRRRLCAAERLDG